MRRAKDEEEDTATDDEDEISVELSTERYSELAAKEEVILTIASNGQGKRTSSYEYRLTNRGGKGVISIMLAKSNADVVSSFPVDESDQIMLIDDNGQLIRCPVSGIRIMGRNTQGVKIFNIDEKSSVVSVERVVEQEDDVEEE
jgi:DNA gyrase subunit A